MTQRWKWVWMAIGFLIGFFIGHGQVSKPKPPPPIQTSDSSLYVEQVIYLLEEQWLSDIEQRPSWASSGNDVEAIGRDIVYLRDYISRAEAGQCWPETNQIRPQTVAVVNSLLAGILHRR